MLQQFLDGKKKYSALIITLAAAVTPIVVQDPETQKTVLDMIPTAAALIAGVFYIITQGKIDQEKVKLAASNGQAATTQAAQAVAQQAAQVSSQAAAIADQAAAEPEVELDIKAFHQEVLDTVKATYTEVNQATIFYKARDKGTVTSCQSLTQARQYWDYLVSLAYDADQYLRELTEKKAGTCGRSPEYYAWQRDLQMTLQNQENLYKLLNSGIDWQAKLTPTNCTLFKVGSLAKEMLAHA